jgi:hypothetical protein
MNDEPLRHDPNNHVSERSPRKSEQKSAVGSSETHPADYIQKCVVRLIDSGYNEYDEPARIHYLLGTISDSEYLHLMPPSVKFGQLTDGSAYTSGQQNSPGHHITFCIQSQSVLLEPSYYCDNKHSD